MPIEIVMPRLGWGGEDGSLVEWMKKDGDEVRAGEVICTVEGDKAVNEVESLDDGTLRIPSDSPAPGVKVPVGTVLAYLVRPGEPAPPPDPLSIPARSGEGEQTAVSDGEGEPRAASNGVGDVGQVRSPGSPSRFPGQSERGFGGEAAPPISPRARRVAGELGVDWARLTGSGRSGRIVERDVRAASAATEAETARVSAVARQVADELGVNLEEVARRKPGGRITREDVEEAARLATVQSAAASGAAEAAPEPRPGAASVREVPMSNVRRIVARRMAESAHTVAPVTLTTEADATELVHLREQLKRDRWGTDLPVPSYNDLFARAVAVALAAHPDLNASVNGDAIVYHGMVNVGIAVDSERGLLVAVLRDVGNKSLQQIARESAPLIERARSGRASSEELSGGTFTITNLGMYDVDAFTPIVNLPEGAILGIGRIVAKPVVVDEENETISVRKMVALSLTFDHRLVDGAPAARFLQEIKRLVERPTLMI